MMARKTPVLKESVEVLELTRQAVESLRSSRCLCGRKKREERSFCLRCYNKLPGEIRVGLWASFRDGYAKNYAAAKAYLEKLKSHVSNVTA